MRIFLAWHNTFSHKKRTLAAMGGICFSILLMFLELGSLDTIKRTASMVYNYMDFDFIMVSYDYEFMKETSTFDRGRLIQAKLTPGVDKVMPMNLSFGQWEDPETEVQSSVTILGIEQEPDFIKNPAIRQGLSFIGQTNSVMLDTLSHPSYGPLTKGREAKINGFDINPTVLFKLGMGLYADGAVIVNNQTFSALTRGDSNQIKFGLIKALPGTDLSLLKERLASNLDDKVKLLENWEIKQMEEEYFVSVLPVGIMVRTGVLVSFIVGGVILFQVLSAEITNRLAEFATLKATGFTAIYIYGVGFQQAVLFAVLSYVPALILGYFLFIIIHKLTRLPAGINFALAGTVFVLSLFMCLVSGFLALRKVKKADPADLF